MWWAVAALWGPGVAWAEELDARVLVDEERRGRLAVEAPPEVASGVVVIEGGTVMTAAGKTYSPGYVVLVDGRIDAVGAGPAPARDGAVRVDGTGRFVTPGLIDTHSHLGVYPSPGANAHSDGNEATAPTTPGVWAEHSVWPQDPGFERAMAGGVTTLQALPGSANLIGGRGVTMHLVPTRGSRAMRFPGAPETVKMACGENPKRVYGQKGGPSTRMGNLHGQRWQEREQGEAKATGRGKKSKGGGGGEAPDRDLDLETLALVIAGEVLPQIHCYRADDMLSMLQLADEFGFQVRSFHHAIEAYKIRDVLAEREVSVSTWADWWGFKLEAYALRWITANAAWTLGIDAEVGTLEAGKRADVVVWSGHPLSVYSVAEVVDVDGALRYDAARPEVWSDFMVGQEVAP